ncbi:MAG: aminomethyl-transferring glycine dehydrogenase subunit GcvPA [candidate division WOR-3 bacterium]
MGHPFLPNSDKDREEMLKFLGVSSYRELLKDIPEEYFFQGELNLPDALSEEEVYELVKSLSEQNKSGLKIFAGGGAYDHYVPKVIPFILSRSEFYTAYTPYQAEVSQGTLQAIFEYQSVICELTKMDVTNASMYDGATALAEACLMALRLKPERKKVLYAQNINPNYISVLKTYVNLEGVSLEEVSMDKRTGTVDERDLLEKIDENTACFAFQTPNFFGVVEDGFKLRNLTGDKGVLLISVYNPISLGILAPPGEYGADIAVGEGQPLGIPLSFGGPYLGLFSTKMEHIRQMPGRIIGETRDLDGNRGFVMTLQTREQHIKREKATSNICSNQNLCALAALIYLSLLGKEGIKDLALQNTLRAHYLLDKLEKEGLGKRVFDGPIFNEFAVELPMNAKNVVEKMLSDGFFAGVPLVDFGYDERWLLISTTEKLSAKDLDDFVDVLRKYL